MTEDITCLQLRRRDKRANKYKRGNIFCLKFLNLIVSDFTRVNYHVLKQLLMATFYIVKLVPDNLNKVLVLLFNIITFNKEFTCKALLLNCSSYLPGFTTAVDIIILAIFCYVQFVRFLSKIANKNT